ncbi:alpha/beta hydrolase [Mesorhizobium sp.]|uniref:alpha/beta fold hydrolase n=1 Tax=Mesorhizobium sp. TaxID=1871066 RepID=UPI000FE8768B|nr:alpha/beta hydrolase [Mesorhizobium sp.]RWB51147.1 MAG: alpha/beta hydrolase [Mesorhizobium sp.]
MLNVAPENFRKGDVMRAMQTLILSATATAMLFLAGPTNAGVQGKDQGSIQADSTAGGIPAGFRSQSADVNGVRIHYVISGKGSPILLVHGWPEDWHEWSKMMPLLATKHTLIAVDLRGFGESQIASSGYDRKTLAEDLFQLMTRLDYFRATVVGHDWGGPVAYAYAAIHRDAVDKLIVVEGAPDGPWTTKQFAPFLHNPLWFFGFFEIPDFAEKVLAGHEKEFLDWFYRNRGFHIVPGSFPEAVITYARPGRLATSLQLYRTIDRDIADNTELSRTPLTIPVLAIGAKYGLGSMVAESMRQVARSVTPVLMENTGHFIPDERPEALSHIIEAFLGSSTAPEDWSPN